MVWENPDHRLDYQILGSFSRGACGATESAGVNRLGPADKEREKGRPTPAREVTRMVGNECGATGVSDGWYMRKINEKSEIIKNRV